ncbi:cell division protein FtsX [Kordiimonas pumila]|uniref:Cell division protein FtsX n=1 Tax=Kordiimonas pumila TaxID=2161677 RepID=A0ABV7D0V8_9PROT|nr:cell division protein [Kordiimonas pumila]
MWNRTLQFLPEQNLREGLLPWVIGVMLFLCTLSLAGALAIGNGLEEWSKSLTSSLTVQIVVEDTKERNAQTDSALTLIRATPGIESAEVMANAEVMALLSPWLGDMPIDSGLPVPTLIEIRLAENANVNTAALAERLKATAPGAQLDDHQEWMSQILDLASVIQLLLSGVVIMVLLSTVAIVIFGCRAGLATHRDIIEIMHFLGAEDKMIARAFDIRYMAHGLKGGFVGVLLAAGSLWLLSAMAEKMGQGLITASMPEITSLLWLIILPLGASCLTMMTARLTVRRALLDMM